MAQWYRIPSQCRRHRRQGFDSWVRKIHLKRKWQLPPVFLPGKPHGQRGLVGDSPWGHIECNKTEQRSAHRNTLWKRSVCCPVASVLPPYGLEPTRPLCSWDTLGKNTGVHCHALLPASSQPRDGTHVSCVSCTGKLVLYHWCLPGATSDKIKGNFTKIEQQDQNGELSDTWKSIDIPVPRSLLCTSRRNQHYFTEETGGRKISWRGNSSFYSTCTASLPPSPLRSLCPLSLFSQLSLESRTP